MVDALRYELGVALEKLLSEDGPVELHAAYAQLPTITPVGMASLLPEARSNLALTLEGGSLSPKLAGAPVGNVRQRMDVLAKRFGDRFFEMLLNDFVRGKPKIAETVDLLVLRSTEIDTQLESNPDTDFRVDRWHAEADSSRIAQASWDGLQRSRHCDRSRLLSECPG